MNDEQVMHAIALDDAYAVERVLARGAAGTTELVTIDGAGPFVRKKIPLELANQTVWSVLGELACARLPKVEATYVLPDLYVVVYDYVPGQTLEELVCAGGGLDAASAISIALDVCEAAAALHSRGVIHRDLSPRNVIIAADGAHLIDLGIARMRVEGATRDTAFLGTRGFASPEQYGFAQTDARSDVYAIGRLLGYMLTGVQPDEDAYEAQLDNAAVANPRPVECVRRACSFEPSARFQSAEEMAAELRSIPKQGSSSGTDGKRAAKWPVILLTVVAALALAAAAFALLGGFSAIERLTGGQGASSASSAQKPSNSASASSKASAKSATATADFSADDDAASNSGAPSVSDLPLEIAESGWSMSSQGYVTYVYALRNTSDNMAVELPSVRVTGYDGDGGVLFSKEDIPMVCLPGQTTYSNGLVESSEKPTRVEFKLKQSSTTELHQVSDRVSLTCSDVKVRTANFGYTVTGSVNVDGTKKALSDAAPLCLSIRLTVVLRDEAGNIVYGDMQFLDTLEPGDNQPFSIELSNTPDFATAEVYAQPW